MFNNMMKNYEKFQIRGSIKEIMRNYGIRTISFKNYFDYLGTTPTLNNIHSVRYDIMNGYIKAYSYKKNDKLKRCGDPIETISNNDYKIIYDILDSLVTNRHNIPNKIKRNIIVKINR